jgi:hypothetical protein
MKSRLKTTKIKHPGTSTGLAESCTALLKMIQVIHTSDRGHLKTAIGQIALHHSATPAEKIKHFK